MAVAAARQRLVAALAAQHDRAILGAHADAGEWNAAVADRGGEASARARAGGDEQLVVVAGGDRRSNRIVTARREHVARARIDWQRGRVDARADTARFSHLVDRVAQSVAE